MTVLTFQMAAAEADGAVGLLHLADAAGIEIRDAEQLPPPGVAPLPADRAELRGYFEDGAAAAAVAAALAARFGGQPLLAEVEASDWSSAWRAHFRPLHRGRVSVLAPWMKLEGPPAPATVVIEPGMAFGTGDHPTTGLCLEALDRFLAAWPNPGAGPKVLDVGTGSGILAIAAGLLGAGQTVGTDNDPVALRVAAENADANRVRCEFRPLPPPGQTFDLVLANILANTLVELADQLGGTAAAGGRLVLSGLLTDQVEDVLAAYQPVWRLAAQTTEANWACLELTRGEGTTHAIR